MQHGILAPSENDVANVEQWLGAQLDIVATTYNNGQWGMGGITWSTSPKKESLQRTFGETDRRLLCTFKFDPDGWSNGDYSAAASGQYDDKYRQMAQELVNHGMGDTIIRGIHEMNLSWSSHYPNDPANFAEGWARMMKEMMSVDGADFTFIFSPSKRRLGVAAECWPGPGPNKSAAPSWDSTLLNRLYVVCSFYDKWHGYEDGGYQNPDQAAQEQAWQEEHQPALDLWEGFAADRGTSFAGSPEWGCMGEGTPQPGESGGDTPWYVQKTIEYGEQNGWLFQTYWNNNHHTIYPRDAAGLDRASDTFKQMVSTRLEGSTDTNTDTTSETYGGYNRPEQGTLDWHTPLNENFQAIESDVLALHERIKQLEKQ